MTWPENRFAYAEISAAALGWDCVIETHLWKIHNVNDPIELYTLFVNKNCQQKQISCSMNQSALSKCDTVKKEFSKHRHDIVSSLPFSKIRKIGPVRKYRIKKIFERVFFLILPQNMHNTFNSFIFQVSQRNWYYLLSLHSTFPPGSEWFKRWTSEENVFSPNSLRAKFTRKNYPKNSVRRNLGG